MSNTVLSPLENVTNTQVDLVHWTCADCDPEGTIAFCGYDVSMEPYATEDQDTDCVVCLDIDVCPRCSKPEVGDRVK